MFLEGDPHEFFEVIPKSQSYVYAMGAQLIFRVDFFIDSVIHKYEEVEKDKFDLSKIFLFIFPVLKKKLKI